MATSHSIVIDAPRVLDSPQIRFFCCLMNRYLREKTEKKNTKFTVQQRYPGSSPTDISPTDIFRIGYFSEKPFYLFILTFIYRWYTKVAETNEFQQKIYKITLTKTKYCRKSNLPANETSTVNISQIFNFGFKFEN